MVGAMGAGYPLSQNWGYNNYSSYLGYNTPGAATIPGYTQPALSSYPPVIDTLLPTDSAETTPISPRGMCSHSFWEGSSEELLYKIREASKFCNHWISFFPKPFLWFHSALRSLCLADPPPQGGFQWSPDLEVSGPFQPNSKFLNLELRSGHLSSNSLKSPSFAFLPSFRDLMNLCSFPWDDEICRNLARIWS